MSSFKFNFVDEDEEPLETTPELHSHTAENTADAPFREIFIDDLIKALPPALSYSPIQFNFPLPKHPDIIEQTDTQPTDHLKGEQERTWHRENLILVRRDLFDARFQLIAQERDVVEVGGESSASEVKQEGNPKGHSEVDFLDNPSDLLPGVYEGGLKTWECSLDLVEYLECAVARACGGPEWIRSTRILEIGCGTAIPTLYLLHELFSNPWKKEMHVRETTVLDTTVCLQDFNSLVLELVTFPNVLLTWYISPLADEYRAENPTESDKFDIKEPGDIEITLSLIDSFRSSLKAEGINIRFYSGSWSALLKEPSLLGDHFDVVLTSETIYNLDSLPSLIELLHRAYLGKELYDGIHQGANIDELTKQLSLESRPQRFGWPICVAAAKVLYFGVGGGVSEFEQKVKARGGRTTTVMEKRAGVGRKLIQVDWPHSSI